MAKGRISQSRLAALAIVLLLIPTGMVLGQYSGGAGTAEDPWQISNKADLLALGANVGHYDANFVMTADINMAGDVYASAIIHQGWGPYFSGVFDGNGFKITGLTIEGDGNIEYLGLFGKIREAEIRNLGLEDCSVSGNGELGGLVGYCNYYAIISNCYFSGSVSGNYFIGGLVGRNGGGEISNCHFTGSVTGEDRVVGGLVGNNLGIVTGCYASGSVSGAKEVGGLVGTGYGGYISDCNFTGSVNGKSDVGGLVGYNDSDILNCHAVVDVNSSGGAGGLVGWNLGYILNSYSVVDVNGYGGVGGLAGASRGIIISCFSKGKVNGCDYVGGLVGTNVRFSENDGGSISKSYFIGSVNGRESEIGGLPPVGYIGGLVGDNSDADINNCYSAGHVSGIRTIGGLVGRNSGNNKIINSYSTSSVSRTGDLCGVGGLVGYNGYGNAPIGCFWDSETSGMSDGIGYEDPDPNGVTGKTTAQMKMLSTFTEADWDFVNAWGIGENQTYPYLRQYPASDINQDGKVDYFDLAELANNWLSGI